MAALAVIQLLRDQPLWYDEEYSVLAARVPLMDLVAAVWHRTGLVSYLSTVPPSFNAPYYAVLHLWSSLAGTSATALRIPSVLCAAAAVAVVAEIGRRLAGPGAGVLAGLLCATGPLLLDEATQARGYGAALLALVLCALFLVLWLGGRRGVGRIAAAATAAALLHWFTIPVLVGLAAAALIRRGRDGRRAAAAIVIGTIPGLLLVGWSALGGAPGAPTPAPVGLALPVLAVADWTQGFPVLSALVAVAAVLAVRSRHRVLLGCWVVVPLILITGLELFRPTYFPRYLLFTLVGVMLAAALGVAALRSRPGRIAAGLLLIGLSVAAVVPTWSELPMEPVDAAVVALAADQQPGEPIIAADGRVALDLDTNLASAPRLGADLVLPPQEFTNQTSSDVAWLVRVVVKTGSIPVLPAQQRLLDTGWSLDRTTTLPGRGVDLVVQRWIRNPA